MRRAVKYFIQFQILGIILLHAVIPHHHGYAGRLDVYHSNYGKNSLLTYLEMIFEESSELSLEQFSVPASISDQSTVETIDLTGSTANFPLLSSLPIRNSSGVCFYYGSQDLGSPLAMGQGKRGPPFDC